MAVLEEGKRQGRPTLAITNDGSSPLAAAADHVIEIHAGPERSVAATKTYTAQLTIMAMLAAAWSAHPERMAELRRLPEALAATLTHAPSVATRAERYRYMEQVVVVGRGYNFAEVTSGGVSLDEVDPKTMESRLAPGLHFVGEILDVDGRIGGFNFQWAWSTAMVAARAIAKKIR